MLTHSPAQYLHSRRIVHRDLKPDNIMLSADMQTVKVGDFGVSKVDNTASGVHVSSPPLLPLSLPLLFVFHTRQVKLTDVLYRR